jgi:SAM-dependent methyltransferase
MNDALRGVVAEQIAAERRFWSTDPFERPGVDSLENFVNKAQDCGIFFSQIGEFRVLFERAKNIVEVGGGQGWASCLVKRMFDGASVHLTDAVDEAVAGHVIWERVFKCTLDGAHAAPAQRLPFADRSVDLIFCFAAAHHFVDHVSALQEVHRVLSQNGACVWLYEPTSPRFFHAAAERRVNRKRPEVAEHVLIPAEIARLATSAGLTSEVSYCTSTAHRGRGATLYYTVLNTLPMLRKVLPCTAHFLLRPAR